MSLSASIAQRLAYQAHHELASNAGKQALEMALCRNDIVHWVRQWVWTYDPRESSSTLPFDPFPKQEEFLRWIEDHERRQRGGLVEKCRDAGVTWCCSLYAVHRWLFREGFAAGFGSRKVEYVDNKNDPKCIFEKLRFLVDNLPAWMMPAGWNREKHACFCKLINPANGATITGEGGDNIGRGGRTTIYFVDEAAFLERPRFIDRALSMNTRVRIDVSTPNGPGNPFFTKRFSGKVDVFTFQWRDDPRKTDAWYAEMKETHDAVLVAQEIDIDYTASIEGICIPAAWVRAAVNLDLPESGPLIGSLDVADEGANSNVFTTRRGPVVRRPIAWNGLNTTETAHKAADLAESLGVEELFFDSNGVGAGVRGTWESSGRELKFIPTPVNTGLPPTDTYWPDGRTSGEKFKNLRAEIAWLVRRRFEKAYEHVEQGVEHPPEEMISIPNDPNLIAQLSLPLVEHTDTGKVQLESKKSMRKRGIPSPDYFDSLCLCFYPRLTHWECTAAADTDSLMAHMPRAASLVGASEYAG